MIEAYRVAQLRAVEQVAIERSGEPALMARAARAVALTVISRLPSPVPGRRVVLLVGPGNNGGDALFAGSLLRRRGCAVTAVLADPERAHAAGLAAARRSGCRVLGADAAAVPGLIGEADAVVDGLVGIAAKPPLRKAVAALAEWGAASPGLKVAIDVPSGVDPDSGRVAGAVFAADVTVTVGAAKTGLLLARQTGELVVAGIGMRPGLDIDSAVTGEPDAIALEEGDVPGLLPKLLAAHDKFSAGAVGVAAGSTRYPGAAVLAVGGAVRLRPGLVRYAGPQSAAVLSRWPEVVATDSPETAGKVQAWVVGPGIGTGATGSAMLREVLAFDGPVVADADALTLLAGDPLALAHRRRLPSVLTPHAGEFARLFPDLDPRERLTSARAAAARSGAVVLLKGDRTVVAAPDGRTAINLNGSPWLASAGSGDVLSGVVGSLLAARLDPFTAATLGAYLHGRAGQRAAAAGHAGAQALWDHLR